jgi:hypothetical protein
MRKDCAAVEQHSTHDDGHPCRPIVLGIRLGRLSTRVSSGRPEHHDAKVWRCPPGDELAHRCFFALARTRASKTGLLIGVCAVWNGFSIVCSLPSATIEERAVSSDAYLDIQLPHIGEKRLDPVVILGLMKKQELHVCNDEVI